MEYRILGPLEVEDDGRAIPVGRPKQRAVLVVLLMHANRVVSTERLIDAVWGEQPPETAQTTLQGYVSALRKTLGADSIVTRAPGYVLETDPESVDLGRFEALVRAGSAALATGNPSAATKPLTEALALWRGEALEDLDTVPFVEIERSRLEEIRLGAIEERVEAELALGRHAELVPELQALVREHPLRERLRGQLMLALYRSERQAEALDVYRQGRHRLTEELGLEPGEPLRRLERAILEHDPALLPPSPAPRAEPPSAAGGEGRRTHLVRRRRILVPAGCLLVAAAVSGLAVALTRGGDDIVAVVPNSVAVIDSAANRLVADIPVGGRPVALASGMGGTWVCEDNGVVVRIDPATRDVVARIDVGTDCHDIAVGYGAVWVAGGDDGTVIRIDPTANEIATPFHLGTEPAATPEPVFWVAAGAGAIWTTRGGNLLRIDPSTNRVVTAATDLPTIAGLTAGPSFVWAVTAPGDNGLLRFDRRGVEQFPEITLGANGVAPAANAAKVWLVVYEGLGEVRSYSITSALNIHPGVGRYPLDIALGDNAVWVIDVRGTVSRIDPRADSVVARIATAPTAGSSLAVGSGAVWVAVQQPA